MAMDSLDGHWWVFCEPEKTVVEEGGGSSVPLGHCQFHGEGMAFQLSFACKANRKQNTGGGAVLTGHFLRVSLSF